MICSVITVRVWAMTSAVHWFNLSMLLTYDKRNSFECSAWSSFSSSISNMIVSASSMFNSCQNDHWLKDYVLLLSIKWSLTKKFIVYHLFRVLHQVLCNCLDQCYEHVWINQSSDLTLINLIKASHDAMLSLNLAHFCWTLWVILSTSFRCSALSLFISFIILLGKHIWHITSHLYRV